jgi:hypothetical protein
MEVIKEGIKYSIPGELKTLNQTITFVHMNEDKVFQDGTTTEDVIRVLINRLRYQISKKSSKETLIALTKLEESLLWLNKRNKRKLDNKHSAKKESQEFKKFVRDEMQIPVVITDKEVKHPDKDIQNYDYKNDLEW